MKTSQNHAVRYQIVVVLGLPGYRSLGIVLCRLRICRVTLDQYKKKRSNDKSFANSAESKAPFCFRSIENPPPRSSCQGRFQPLFYLVSDYTGFWLLYPSAVWNCVENLIGHVYDIQTVSLVQRSCPFINDLRCVGQTEFTCQQFHAASCLWGKCYLRHLLPLTISSRIMYG